MVQKEIKYTATENPDQIAEMWKRQLHPGRISSYSVKVYGKYLKGFIGRKKGAKVLLLGSTPELRDLLSKHNCQTTVIDINFGMILGMRKLMRVKNPDEILVKSNWLTAPLKNNYYDFVLGDAALQMVGKDKIPALLKKINELLKPSGILIAQSFLFTSDYKILNFKELVAKYGQQKNINEDDFRWEMLLSTWKPKTSLFYYAPYANWVDKNQNIFKKWYNQGKLSKRGLLGIFNYRGSKKVATIVSERWFESLLKKYFKVIATDSGDQVLSKFHIAKKK